MGWRYFLGKPEGVIAGGFGSVPEAPVISLRMLYNAPFSLYFLSPFHITFSKGLSNDR